MHKNYPIIIIAVSVPISRSGGRPDSREILTGVALAQYEWNEKENHNKKLLVLITDDGHGENLSGDCGDEGKEGECKTAR